MTKEQKKELDAQAIDAALRAYRLDGELQQAKEVLKKLQQDVSGAADTLEKVQEEWSRADNICKLFHSLCRSIEYDDPTL
jgi:type II secretory pathway pseudopilin PulG